MILNNKMKVGLKREMRRIIFRQGEAKDRQGEVAMVSRLPVQ